MDWQIEKGVRCDIVTYKARNLAGKRGQVRIFPQGNRQGDVRGEDIGSMVIRAPHGVRVVLITEPGPGWRDHPWRCIRVLEGASLPARKPGLPGVRIPDLDLLDEHGAKKTDPDLESTYPRAASIEDGQGWTFGRIGRIKNRVQRIRVERDGSASGAVLAEPDALARAVVERLGPDSVDEVAAALEAVLTDNGHDDVVERVHALVTWARGSE